jgi:hypothetical protein
MQFCKTSAFPVTSRLAMGKETRHQITQKPVGMSRITENRKITKKNEASKTAVELSLSKFKP